MVDNIQLTDLINKDPLLKLQYRGCYARDIFSALQKNGFIIVNTHPSTQPGEHWLLIASENGTVLLYDSFGRDFREYFADIFEKVGRSVRPRNQSIFQYKPIHLRRYFSLLIVNSVAYIVFIWHIFTIEQNSHLQRKN